MSSMVIETLWVEKSQAKWSKLGYIPQEDLTRFCESYVPALIRSAPDDARMVNVTLSYVGRTGVFWMHELLNLDLKDKPPDGQLVVLASCMVRMAMQVSAKARVRRIYCNLMMKGQEYE